MGCSRFVSQSNWNLRVTHITFSSDNYVRENRRKECEVRGDKQRGFKHFGYCSHWCSTVRACSRWIFSRHTVYYGKPSMQRSILIQPHEFLALTRATPTTTRTGIDIGCTDRQAFVTFRGRKGAFANAMALFSKRDNV